MPQAAESLQSAGRPGKLYVLSDFVLVSSRRKRSRHSFARLTGALKKQRRRSHCSTFDELLRWPLSTLTATMADGSDGGTGSYAVTLSGTVPAALLTKQLTTGAEKPVCKYGSACYRNNPLHFVEFAHP